MEEGDRMRKFLGWTTALSFLFVLGTVGAIEQDMISLKTGVIRSIIGLVILWVSIEKANGFYPEDEKSRPRCSRPKGGKRKSSNTLYHKIFGGSI